jgi:Rrf2 family transcriptional regulator, iron-sulfur cluster assembly transcription factor
MKLKTEIRYGVRSLCDIAYHSTGTPVQAKDISERQGISLEYIMQIFYKLTESGIIKSVQGRNGGYFLARRPEEITVGDVIRAVDGKSIDLVEGHDKKRESGVPYDQLEKGAVSDIWDEASRRLMDYFDSITLKQICQEARGRGVGI